MRFVKMHGTGNDYVYLDGFTGDLPHDLPALARAVSHRHFGIGADGLIVVAPPDAPGFAGRMVMFNADGSVSGMCGNGLRCVAKFLFDRGRTGGAASFNLQTGAGPRQATVVTGSHGRAEGVTLSMGAPLLDAPSIPTLLAAGGNEDEIEVLGRIFRGTAVGMGNPHFVTFVNDVDVFPVDTFGPPFEHHPMFPSRVNVEFVQILGHDRFRQRTWERGSGETWACGTGASAVCVAAALRGYGSGKARVDLLGGHLDLSWGGGDSAVFLTGDAVQVFEGEWPTG